MLKTKQLKDDSHTAHDRFDESYRTRLQEIDEEHKAPH
jgi:hypothetical protein